MKRVADRVEVRVKDDGKGIPPEDVERVFDRFFTRRDEGGGTGLGLAMTRAIIDAHSGEIEVETSGGSIKAREIRGNLAAQTSGGSIHVSEVSGNVEVETSGGPVRIRDVDGNVEAQTSGGSFSVRFTGAPAGELETSGGSIEVQFPSGKGVDLEAQTSGGRVTIDEEFTISGSIERSQVEAKLNGGGAELSLETSGGNIRVRAR